MTGIVLLAFLATPLEMPALARAHPPVVHLIRKVSLNNATSKELRTLPGVGELLAQRIIAIRPFRQVEDLGRIKGITPHHYQQLKRLVTL